MQIIRYLKFKTDFSGTFYMVGADPAKMRATAKQVDASADAGTEVNSEAVLALAVTPERRGAFENGVRLAKGGHSDYYLFTA